MLYIRRFPASCFRQRTYVAQDLFNETWTHSWFQYKWPLVGQAGLYRGCCSSFLECVYFGLLYPSLIFDIWYTHIYIYIHTHIYTFILYTHTHTHTHTHTYIYTRTHTHTYIYMKTHTLYIYAYIYNKHTDSHTHTDTHRHTHIYIFFLLTSAWSIYYCLVSLL